MTKTHNSSLPLQSMSSDKSVAEKKLVAEPLLEEETGMKRYILFPIPEEQAPIWTAYKLQESCFWTAQEIDLTQDRLDFKKKLNDGERLFLSHVLAFFASADLLVCENLLERFSVDVKWSTCKAYYGIQSAVEMVHSEVYSKLIDTLITDKEEKHRLFNAIETIPAVRAKQQWAAQYMDESKSFATRLVGFCVFEGLLFSASFCSIYFLKTRGLMPGLSHANELISRDEGQHAAFAALLYKNYVRNKLTDDEVHSIFRSAVETEREFVCHSLPVSLLGMNSALMMEYVEYCANKLLRQLGHAELYPGRDTCVFDFMTSLSVPGKTSFFERRVSEYQIGVKNLNQVKTLEFTEEF